MLQPPRLAVDDVGAVPAAAATRTPPDNATTPTPSPTGVSSHGRTSPSPLAVSSPPEALRVPAAGVATQVVPIGVERSGALQLPEDRNVVGWWAAGALPGSAQGSVVLAGHVDSARLGAGVLKGLVELPLPADVEVADSSGDVTAYQLVARRTFSKTALPADVFRRDGTPQLVIVTCGGPFDTRTGHYRDNVVLYAVPAR